MFDFLTGGGRNGPGVRAASGAASFKGEPVNDGAVLDPSIDVAAPRHPPVGEQPAIRPGGPTIGLALGGGVARGFAHIGILRALMRYGLKFDVITGTSIGAIAGGCYAADRLDAFEDWARSLTRRRVLGYLDLSLAGSGLIGGMRLAERLNAMLGATTIDALPQRFAAIATEIGTGHEIWLTRGRLADALRASSSLPGVFAPARVGGRWLMDGALVNPVPVSVARALGARVVIAVSLNTDLSGRGSVIASHGADDTDKEVVALPPPRGLRGVFGAERTLKRQLLGGAGGPGFSTVMMEAINITQDRITRARLAGDPPDVIIKPRLGNIGLIDFHRAADLIALGEEAAEKALDAIIEAVAALA